MEGLDPCFRLRDDKEAVFPKLAGSVSSGARVPPCPVRPREELSVIAGAAGDAHVGAQECHPGAPGLRRAEQRRAEPAVA